MSVELMSNKELMSSKELRQQQAGKRQHNTNSRQVKQAKLAYTSRRNLMAEPHPPAVEDMQPWQLRKNISRSHRCYRRNDDRYCWHSQRTQLRSAVSHCSCSCQADYDQLELLVATNSHTMLASSKLTDTDPYWM